jgi:tripartite-type tricarboxylate transporter receptor subunit TctC
MAELTRRQTIAGLAAGGLTGIAARPTPAAASSADLFAGKTVTVICGYDPGGGVDLGTRLIARHIVRFLPGDVKTIVKNMQGASGIVAANFLYLRAPPDGLTLAVPGRNWILKPAMGIKNATFDPIKLGYIGSTGGTNSVGWIRSDLGIRSAAEFKSSKKTIVFGGLTQSTLLSWGPKLLENSGLPVSVIMGYDNTSRMMLAIEQKELDAIYTAESTLARRRDLIDRGILIPVFQSAPLIREIPLIEELVPPAQRPLLQLVHGSANFGMPLVAPPGMPDDRLATLRKAFADMTRDKAFQEEAKLIGEPYEAPIEGQKLAGMVRSLVELITPTAAKALRELTGEG